MVERSSPVSELATLEQQFMDVIEGYWEDSSWPPSAVSAIQYALGAVRDAMHRASQPATPTRPRPEYIRHRNKITSISNPAGGEEDRYRVDDPWCRPAPSSAGTESAKLPVVPLVEIPIDKVWITDDKRVFADKATVAALLHSAQSERDPLKQPQYVIEGIILRRLHEKRIEGYTIETAKEIAEALAHPSTDRGASK